MDISLDEAKRRGWTPEIREAKNRYLYLLPSSRSEKKKLIQMCKYDLVNTMLKKEQTVEIS